MVLPQGGVHLFQGGEYSPPTGWLDKPLNETPHVSGVQWGGKWGTVRRIYRFPLPRPTRGSGKCRKFVQRGREGASAGNKFSAFLASSNRSTSVGYIGWNDSGAMQATKCLAFLCPPIRFLIKGLELEHLFWLSYRLNYRTCPNIGPPLDPRSGEKLIFWPVKI